MRPSSVKTTCCYCGVGCGVVAETLGGVVTDVRGDPDHPANRGLLCTKGSTLHLTTGLAGRLLHPELRTSRDGTRRRASWSEALDTSRAALPRRWRNTVPTRWPSMFRDNC